MELIKRFVKGGYLRTASNLFGTIESTTDRDVTFNAVNGETVTMSKGGAIKTTRQAYEEAVKRQAEVDAKLAADLAQAAEDDAAKKDLDQVVRASAPTDTPPVDEEVEEKVVPQSIVRSEYKERYIGVQSAAGHSSKICGDEVSNLLRGLGLHEAARKIAEYTGWDAAELLSRYDHLNPGQQRMNMGNRFRNWAKEHQPDLLIKETDGDGDEE